LPPDNLILAFDTSVAHCAAALLSNARIIASQSEDMKKGQAERLLPLMQEMLATHGLVWADIALLAPGTGPGNFTGIRISVSAARGLALSLGIPAIGISMFEVAYLPFAVAANDPAIVCLPGPAESAYVQRFSQGAPTGCPLQIAGTLPETLTHDDPIVIGYRADDMAGDAGLRFEPAKSGDIAASIAACAEARFFGNHEIPDRPVPIYVRAPDAAPPRDIAPVFLT